jgi:hypothetical protein
MHRQIKLLSFFLSASLLVGCGSSSSTEEVVEADTDMGETAVQTIDATAYDHYTYFNLDRAEVVALTDDEAQDSTDWHIAFKRFDVILNGGNSGAGSVEGAVADMQDEFYDAEGAPNKNIFLNADPLIEEESLLATYDLSLLTFEADQAAAAIGNSWYNYDVETHTLSAVDDLSWFIRSGDGDSYAKFYTDSIIANPDRSLDVSFEFDVQAPTSNESDPGMFTTTATFNATISAGLEVCFDFDTNTNVACTGTAWDLKLKSEGRSYNLLTNGGISGEGNGATYGPIAKIDADTYTSATMASDGSGRDISNYYKADANAGVFTTNTWSEYSLNGNHKLWPNYRTYVIDTDANDPSSAVYNLQIIGYYDASDESGNPNIRFVAN